MGVGVGFSLINLTAGLTECIFPNPAFSTAGNPGNSGCKILAMDDEQIDKIFVGDLDNLARLSSKVPEWNTAVIRDHDVATPTLLCNHL